MEAIPFIYPTQSIYQVFNDPNLFRKILLHAGCKPGSNKSGVNRCVGETKKGNRCKCKVSNERLLCSTHLKKFYRDRLFYLDVFYISKPNKSSKDKMCGYEYELWDEETNWWYE